jgi:hypothetical protein
VRLCRLFEPEAGKDPAAKASGGFGKKTRAVCADLTLNKTTSSQHSKFLKVGRGRGKQSVRLSARTQKSGQKPEPTFEKATAEVSLRQKEKEISRCRFA